jgi:hypothetical protein
VIVVAVRWYLRHGLSYRDVEELLAERGVEVDHVTKGGVDRPVTGTHTYGFNSDRHRIRRSAYPYVVIRIPKSLIDG